MKFKLLTWFKQETDKPYIIYLLGVIAFFESIIFPIPVDVFTLTLASAHPKRWLKYAMVATISSVVGAVVGYILGAYLFTSFGVALIEFYGYEEHFQRVTELYQQNTFLVVFAAAFTPIPYKVFTIAGGASGVNLFSFIVASILGRGLRFFAETWIPYRFGSRISKTFQKYLGRISLLFAGIVVFYFVLLWFELL